MRLALQIVLANRSASDSYTPNCGVLSSYMTLSNAGNNSVQNDAAVQKDIDLTSFNKTGQIKTSSSGVG